MREPLDPDLAELVADHEAAGVPQWHEMSVAEARRVEADLFTPADATRDPVRRVADAAVPGPDEGREVPVRVYTPDADGPHPVLVFCHGGGWTLGTLESADDLCRGLCRRTGQVVVSVDYRLAPEHPFPAGLADAIAVLEWAASDPARLPTTDTVTVAGTSAGGNLAAGLARYSVEVATGPVVDHQLLLYPMLDDGGDRASYHENSDAPFLVPDDVAWFWAQYLRHRVDAADPYAVPLLDADRGDLPPCTVVTAGHDPLRDEAVAYADALAAAGTEVTHHHSPSLCHGFLSLAADVPRAKTAFDEIAHALPGPAD